MTTEKSYKIYFASEEEVERLADNHEVVKDGMGGSLIVVPVDPSAAPLKILDSRASDGTWISDLASSTPVQHQIIGVDIDPSTFHKETAEGQSYVVQDITKPWPREWKGSFDIVHQRQGMAVNPQQKEIVHNLAELVKPGGWVQFVEAINNGSGEKANGPATSAFRQLIRGVITLLGCDVKATDKISEWLEEFGFVNVQSRDIFLEYGASNSNSELAKKGLCSSVMTAKALIAFAKMLPEDAILPDTIIETLAEDLKMEMTEKGGTLLLRIALSHKPLPS